MRPIAIIGANYGDEGKGLMADYICSKDRADVVVRFNGGAQAGHTVVTPTGQRHVFHHFGSGTFQFAPTYLSRFFIVNPILFRDEYNKLASSGAPRPYVYVDPRCQVTTPADMLINQAFEKKRGHGSCGVGINETMQRKYHVSASLTVDHLTGDYERRVKDIFNYYTPQRLQDLGLDMEWTGYDKVKWMEVFKEAVEFFLDHTLPVTAPPGGSLLFEGAQGLALDQNAKDFPHVTHSNTGMKNVRELCKEWGLPPAKLIYVTRTYLTRHGKGLLPYQMPMPAWVKDNTNLPHEFQGTLRYAPMNYVNIEAMHQRIIADAGDQEYGLAVTCVDQQEQGLHMMRRAGLPIRYESRGPTRSTITQVNPTILA